jgi:hypothetical protein
MKIVYEILEKMVSIRKPQKKFMEMLITTMLSMYGRMNFRNMARYAPCHEKTFSRNFAKHFDYLEFNMLAIAKVVTPQHRVAVGFDQVFIEKSGEKTYGVEKFWNGSQGRAQEGMEASGIALINVDTKTAFPLLALQTLPQDEIKSALNNSEATRIDFYTHIMQEQLPKIQIAFPHVKHVVADALFTNKKFVTGVQKSGFHIVSKLRSDANLHSLKFEKKKGRGRPKKYGHKIDVNDSKDFDFVRKIDETTTMFVADLYSRNLEQAIRVVRLEHKHKKKTIVRLLYSTDLTLSAQEIVDIYASRYQIEFIFRDGKQFTGLTEGQARSKEKIHNHINASLSAQLIAKTEMILASEHKNERIVFSMDNVKRKNHNEMQLNRIIAMLGLDQSLIKSLPGYKTLIEYGVIIC